MTAIVAEDLARELETLDLEGRLRVVSLLPGRKVFTTSLGIEDQVIIAAIARTGAAIAVATLDTERLFPQTAALIDQTERRYGLAIERFRPAQHDIDAYVARFGLNGFYESVEARHACCDVRKLKPLTQALQGADFWITGVRRDQSGNRSATPLCERDAARGLVKVNPLADVTLERIRDYAGAHDVPLNPLHARGYPSIGCEPCTRAIKPGESERAGRWWWEHDQTRECGLHVKPTALSAIPHNARAPTS